MGIVGLTTYIHNQSNLYLEDYILKDTYLVIDGNSICCQIYQRSKCNCTFGGDYDTYAQCVSNFFEDLLKCNVRPLVLIDGGHEKNKMKTVLARTKDKVRTAASFSPLTQQKMKFFPIFMIEVFKDVMMEKNIKYVQCLFEADNHVAAIARKLNCPVLSYDSDFYIYGSLYIPFNTLDNYVVKHENGYGKCCKIYRIEYLLNSFKGLEESMLPLAAILLGNDYVKRGTFKNFFRHLKLNGASRKKFNHQQCRIKATLTWLGKYTLDNAIIAILSRLTKPMRQRILNIIENNINNYINLSSDMLVPLGFPQEYGTNGCTYQINTTFKFHGDISTLTYIEEVCTEDDTSEEEEEEEGEYEHEMMNVCNESAIMYKNVAISNLPTWFVNEFLMAVYPSYFMDLINQGLYICAIQVEDYNYPSSALISLQILNVILKLLESGINDKIRTMKYTVRGQNRKLKIFEVENSESALFKKLPHLFNIKEIPITTQKQIIYDTLDIGDSSCIDQVPPEWMLYVACIKYWIQHQQTSLSHKCYLYSLFFCLLFNIIDTKIGKNRKINHFQARYSKKMNDIGEKRKSDNYKAHVAECSTIMEAYNKINSDDCMLVAPFFISHFEMDKKLYSNPKKFNRTIVHVFAEFQQCLRHAMHLNALLGQPFQQPKVANLFNGTLLYNLSTNFRTRVDIDGYIHIVLQKSPSLFTFFNMFLSKIRTLFPLLQQNEINLQRKQKKRSKYLTSCKNEVENIDADEYFSAEENLCDPTFHDPNNHFSLLYNHV